MTLKHIQQNIVSFLRDRAGGRAVVLGLSGGVDSSTVAFLAVEALGASRVHALIMPSSTNSPDDLRLAQTVASTLKIHSEVIDIDPLVTPFVRLSDAFQDKKTLGNLKARVRMCLLYGAANTVGGLVLGTGNKSEIMVGYATKYGDAGCDLLPLGDLYKTEVFQLARHLDVPPEIITRPPTAGLWEGQTDEGELGITYEILDKILQAIEQHGDLLPFEHKDIAKVQSYIATSQHKREVPPVCVIKNE